MDKKKIVFRVIEFPTKSETFVTHQIILAIKLGYDVSILVNKKNALENSSQPELVEKYSLLDKTVELQRIMPKGILVRIIKIISLLVRGVTFSFISTFNYFKYGKQGLIGNLFFRLYEFKNYLDTDLFHIQFGTMKYPLDMLKKYGFYNGKLLTTFHGYDIYNKTNLHNSIAEDYRDIFKFGELFTCNTMYLAGLLKELKCPENKLQVIPVAVDTEYFVPTNDSRKGPDFKLLSVGRLIKLKGFENGIKAVANLLIKDYNVTYTIIGEGEERENLQNLIDKLNIAKYVFLAGAKKQDEIKNALQNADIFLMTSTYDETGRREAQGLVTGEAQACGLPVVAFRSGGVPYTIEEGKTGLLSEENDYKDMAKNIERLLTDEKLRKSMSTQARELVENNYSQHHLDGIWKNIYEDLLSSKKIIKI